MKKGRFKKRVQPPAAEDLLPIISCDVKAYSSDQALSVDRQNQFWLEMDDQWKQLTLEQAQRWLARNALGDGGKALFPNLSRHRDLKTKSVGSRRWLTRTGGTSHE